MSVDVNFKYNGNRDDLRNLLKKYICAEDDEFDEFTLKYYDKWAWLFFYEDKRYNFFNVKFSRDFNDTEIDKFINEMISNGLEVDDNPPY